MKKGVVPVLLFLTVIIISIIMGLQEHFLAGLMWAGIAGIAGLAGFFMTNWSIRRNPGIHRSFNLSDKRHIILPFFYLVMILSGNIVWIFSPELGVFMISINYIYLAIAVPFSALEIGEIFAYTKSKDIIGWREE